MVPQQCCQVLLQWCPRQSCCSVLFQHCCKVRAVWYTGHAGPMGVMKCSSFVAPLPKRDHYKLHGHLSAGRGHHLSAPWAPHSSALHSGWSQPLLLEDPPPQPISAWAYFQVGPKELFQCFRVSISIQMACPRADTHSAAMLQKAQWWKVTELLMVVTRATCALPHQGRWSYAHQGRVCNIQSGGGCWLHPHSPHPPPRRSHRYTIITTSSRVWMFRHLYGPNSQVLCLLFAWPEGKGWLVR